jgi:putative colanic acid biosynthesis acetyltransferase WcaF
MKSLNMHRTRLDHFDAGLGLDRGRSKLYEILWYLTKCIFFLSPFPWPTRLKCALLKAFGAKVGEGVNIKPRVNIHLPWKLELGEWCWLGEEVFILNFEPVRIGAHACISQRAFLCAGNHDFRDPAFSYRNGPITIRDGAWVGAQVFVGPGLDIGEEAVLTAGAIVTESVPGNRIYSGNPAKDCGVRWKTES